MVELLRSNDVVSISWTRAVLAEAGIDVLVLDTHTSAIEGSIGAVPRRLMVAEDDLARARRLLDEAARDRDIVL
ncbi:MAG: DUF2007 domain-containing protein [Geminicoccaceae bacterium]|nr:DUF2007 domain-containing protein [Geminicoccaceae bacterium]